MRYHSVMFISRYCLAKPVLMPKNKLKLKVFVEFFVFVDALVGDCR